MGLDLTIRLTPYVKVHKYKDINIPKVKRVCPNHATFKAKDEKFCPHCGAEIVNQDYTEVKQLLPYRVFDEAGLAEDSLITCADFMDGILKPNSRPPQSFSIEEQENSAHNLLGKEEVITLQLEWFKHYYAKYIEALVNAYGVENVEICWGLLHYWR